MRPRKYCSVTNCKNNSNVTGVRFFKFPKDLKLKDAWIQFVDKQEWQPKTNSFICSAHFPAHHITAKGHLTLGSHKFLMIKNIVGCYVSMRGRRSAKMLNEKKIRMQITKIILLKNQ